MYRDEETGKPELFNGFGWKVNFCYFTFIYSNVERDIF